MWDIKAVKARGRQAFKANYWPSVIVSFVLTLFMGGGAASSASQTSNSASTLDPSTMSEEEMMLLVGVLFGIVAISTVISLVVKIFLANPIEVGSARFFKKNLEQPGVGIGTIGEGFGGYGRTFVTLLLRDLFILLWTLLLVIPGIMKAYSYRLVPYIVKDEPNLPAGEVLKRSAQLMQGNRWKSFVLDLSFIGWYFFGAITFGLGLIFWTAPYVQSTNAALYLELADK